MPKTKTTSFKFQVIKVVKSANIIENDILENYF